MGIPKKIADLTDKEWNELSEALDQVSNELNSKIVRDYIIKNSRKLILFEDVKGIKNNIMKSIGDYVDEVEAYITSPNSVDIYVKPKMNPNFLKVDIKLGD